ncbi:MAG: methionyl-tRNA formyltransferase [Firmicutes bacterium]|nr:methionyl-tRNA formyltransferase [Bacillota bacterium]
MNLEDVVVKRELKIVFMGTPEFSVPVLEGLIKNYKVRAIVTQPDRPIGRHGETSFSPVKKVGLENTILVLQPEKIKDNIEMITSLEPDLIITCAYGQILPKEILNCPRLGCINVHASLLPRLRGGAPIHRAIIEGHRKTGITIMHMGLGMDDGDIISQEEIEIDIMDTASTLHDKLSILGRDLLIKTLPSIIDGTSDRVKQDSSKVTFGLNIKREDERIHFSKTKREVYNLVRGLNSWPGSYCLYEGKILKVWECREGEIYSPQLFDGQITAIYEDGFGVKVSNGEIIFTSVQPEGKKKMSAVDFVNGITNKEEFIGKILD